MMAEQLAVQFEFKARYSFEDYFVGDNAEVVEHLQACVRGGVEPQIYLWGQAGLGKSHLLQACCNQAHREQLTAFYFAFAAAVLPDPALLTDLERFDLVCLDNIDGFAGDPVWERAFFNFFNRHREQGHRLIVSASCPPDRLPVRLPDLKTRLSWGLTLKLKPLSDDDTIAALIFKARQMGFEITPPAGDYLLKHYRRDRAALWGLLEKLDRASLAAQRKLTRTFLKAVLEHGDDDQ